MNPDPDRDAEHLLIEAAEFSRAAKDLSGAAEAVRATGTDSSGQVEVRLASAGRPDQILVRAGWQRNLDPSLLGAAVIEAAKDAALIAVRQWASAVERSGRLDQAADLGARRLGIPAGAADSEELDSLTLDEIAVGGRVRDVNELAETAIKALQDAASFSEQVVGGLQQPPASDGADDDQYVQVTIVGGQVVGCRVSENWADGRDGHTLGAALTQAARRAAEALPSYSVPERGATDMLVADVLATLRYDTGQQAAPGDAGLSGQEQQR